ncbi:MAG: terminase large subunit [Gemmiger sp.]|uniref:terminase large subunit domain-containing protein n=1 Tax=Gemmiger sp. TaxID=2049027 RepID=UPI002A90942E|nr:terminase large subunit [Gemmiger sp.]MDY5502442.1 terminase large subunit [Gemmiger sp.]
MADSVKRSPAVKYAKWCLQPGNDQVGSYVKKQCAQWLDIVYGRVPGVRVDEEAYRRICGLLRLMVHPDLGCTLYEGLEDYAWLLITAVLCTKDRRGRRYYQTAVLEICRKNYKTFNSAIIFILLLLTEPKFSRFFSVAPDLKLSSELKVAIRKIIKSSPALADESIFKVLRSEIRCKPTDSEYTPLAYSRDKMDGKLANAFLADEAGAMDAYPIEAMRSSQITLESKLGIIISTQYPNDDNAMIDEIDISKKTLDGLLEGQARFSLLYEPDTALLCDDLWMTDDRVIYQSNPVAVKNATVFSALRAMRTMAVLYENKRENYLCKHNNIKYKGLGVEGYVEITKVQACARPEDPEFWQGRPVYLGLDLSQTDDNTSVAMATVADRVLYAKVFGFVPADRVEYKSKKEAVDYRRLIAAGVCFACGDEVIDYNAVANNGYSGDLEMAMFPKDFLTAVFGMTEGTTSKVLTENSKTEPKSFALLFEEDGDTTGTKYVLYNCTATRPTRDFKTNEDSKEPSTSKISVTAAPLSDGRVLAMTQDDTPTETVNKWYTKVFEETA